MTHFGLKIAQFVRTLYSVGAKKRPFVRSRLSKIRTYGLTRILKDSANHKYQIFRTEIFF